jgi:hypothetical protein
MATLSPITDLRLELMREGFTLRDETPTNFEFSAKNAEGESRTVYVDNEEMSVCLSDNDGAGRLTRADKYPLRNARDLEKVRYEIFQSI